MTGRRRGVFVFRGGVAGLGRGVVVGWWLILLSHPYRQEDGVGRFGRVDYSTVGDWA